MPCFFYSSPNEVRKSPKWKMYSFFFTRLIIFLLFNKTICATVSGTSRKMRSREKRYGEKCFIHNVTLQMSAGSPRLGWIQELGTSSVCLTWVGGRNPGTWTTICYFPKCFGRKLESRTHVPNNLLIVVPNTHLCKVRIFCLQAKLIFWLVAAYLKTNAPQNLLSYSFWVTHIHYLPTVGLSGNYLVCNQKHELVS